MGSARDVRARRVVMLSAALALAGAAGFWMERTASPSGASALPWWALAGLFAVTGAVPVRVRMRRGARLVTLSAIPLVTGLMLSRPADLMAGAVLGALAVMLVVRRQGLVSLVFRTALAAAEVSVAVAVVGAGRTDAVDSRRAWGVVALAVVAAGALDLAASALVAAWYHDHATPRQHLVRLLGRSLGSAAVGAVGVVAVLACDRGADAVPLAATGAVALLAYRAFDTLAERHASLNRIYELSKTLADAQALDPVVRSVLTQSVDLVRAGYGEVVLRGVDAGYATRWTCRRGSPSGPQPVGMVPLSPEFPPRVTVHIGTRTLAERDLLTSREVRAALVVPLAVDEQVSGYLLVADRTGEQSRFSAGEARLLETVANQAGVALRNGRLVDLLRHEARHDELTGLPNRFELRDALERAAVAASRSRDPCAVMVLDFDGFKAINDTLGHQAGDDLLKVLAGRLDDVGGDEALVTRLGGDEFAVLLPDCPTPEVAAAFARRLLGVFEEPVAVAGSRLRLGGSLGIAMAPRHGSTGSDLLRNADIAMYAAKSGGGGFRVYSDDLVQGTEVGLSLASDLRDALARDEIGIAVQPLIDLATGALHSVEVLARWRHAEHGDVSPETFFAAAERSGQTGALSRRILDLALQACHRWDVEGRPVRIAVNLAPRWLADPTLPEQLSHLFHYHGVPGDLICLEITENGVIADTRKATATLTGLRGMGVHVSIDDFGTGYSSLAYLSRLPIDQMKIDKSFVERMHTSPRDLAVVKSIIDLGRNMQLEVVAEGVTDLSTLQALRGMGCQLGQGFYFSQPVSTEELSRHLGGSPDRRPPSPRRDPDVSGVRGADVEAN